MLDVKLFRDLRRLWAQALAIALVIAGGVATIVLVVHVTTWRSEDVLTVPVAALFQQDEDWAVFTVEDGRARTAIVTLGHRNERMAEVLSGLSTGDAVVLHPNDRIKNGVAVAQRSTE